MNFNSNLNYYSKNAFLNNQSNIIGESNKTDLNFDSHDSKVTKDIDKNLTVSNVFNGEFYQARLINPPHSEWKEVGIGKTENEAFLNLMSKLNRVPQK